MEQVTENAVTGELRRLVRQSSGYLVGIVGSMALGFISFPIFTRAFSVADYGTIDYLQKILLLLTATSKCGMQNSALRFFNRDEFAADPAAEKRYYSTIFLGSGAASLLLTCVFAAGVWGAPRSLLSTPLSATLTLASVLIL